MDRFGFWHQPLVLGYVWPKHLYPFPHWSYQLVVHRIHNPQKKKIVLTETIFSFFKNVPFPRGPIINLYYYVMVTPGPTTHTTINHLGGSGLSTPFQTCWDTLYCTYLWNSSPFNPSATYFSVKWTLGMTDSTRIHILYPRCEQSELPSWPYVEIVVYLMELANVFLTELIS